MQNKKVYTAKECYVMIKADRADINALKLKHNRCVSDLRRQNKLIREELVVLRQYLASIADTYKFVPGLERRRI